MISYHSNCYLSDLCRAAPQTRWTSRVLIGLMCATRGANWEHLTPIVWKNFDVKAIPSTVFALRRSQRTIFQLPLPVDLRLVQPRRHCQSNAGINDASGPPVHGRAQVRWWSVIYFFSIFGRPHFVLLLASFSHDHVHTWNCGWENVMGIFQSAWTDYLHRLQFGSPPLVQRWHATVHSRHIEQDLRGGLKSSHLEM